MKVVLNKCWGGAAFSKEAMEFIKNKLPDFNFDTDVLPRHHPVLVECVEKLGIKASGRYSNFQVIEVPYTRYILKEDDGNENIFNIDDIAIDGNNLEYSNQFKNLHEENWFVNIRPTCYKSLS